MIGVAAGVVAIIFTDSLLALRTRFRRMSRVPEWVRPGVGGLVTGALAVRALLAFHTRGVTGGGYDTLGEALTGQLAVHVMLALCAAKVVATVFSYSSGGAGGVFAPYAIAAQVAHLSHGGRLRDVYPVVARDFPGAGRGVWVSGGLFPTSAPSGPRKRGVSADASLT